MSGIVVNLGAALVCKGVPSWHRTRTTVDERVQTRTKRSVLLRSAENRRESRWSSRTSNLLEDPLFHAGPRVTNISRVHIGYRKRMAEREGFEPSKPFWGLRDFESRAFDHSATSPYLQNSRIFQGFDPETREASRSRIKIPTPPSPLSSTPLR